jgi:TonB family protein
VARRPLERERVCLDGGRRTTQLMRDSLGCASPIMRKRIATTVCALAAAAAAACTSAPNPSTPPSPLVDLPSVPWTVDEPPKPLAEIAPTYPATLRKAHAKGRVVFRYVIDEQGLPDMKTFTILSSPHPEFSEAVKAVVQVWLFAPARNHGVPVRVLVQQWVDFSPPPRSH